MFSEICWNNFYGKAGRIFRPAFLLDDNMNEKKIVAVKRIV